MIYPNGYILTPKSTKWLLIFKFKYLKWKLPWPSKLGYGMSYTATEWATRLRNEVHRLRNVVHKFLLSLADDKGNVRQNSVLWRIYTILWSYISVQRHFCILHVLYAFKSTPDLHNIEKSPKNGRLRNADSENSGWLRNADENNFHCWVATE